MMFAAVALGALALLLLGWVLGHLGIPYSTRHVVPPTVTQLEGELVASQQQTKDALAQLAAARSAAAAQHASDQAEIQQLQSELTAWESIGDQVVTEAQSNTAAVSGATPPAPGSSSSTTSTASGT